jgi:pantoate--beta-alanine ligase
MEVLYTIAQVREVRGTLSGSLGFVPTMGYLHDGHLELVRQARVDNSHVAVSIFVNPTQFESGEDLASYPRNAELDLELLENDGTDLVFMPEPAEVYPHGFGTWVDVEKVTEPLEGAHRPGHFRGVATVVAKLFNIVEPTRAYFGQKDAQQLAVIKKMVRDLDMDIEIVPVPTVREHDGLAMSSRNVHLSAVERESALVLYSALFSARTLWEEGERSADALRKQMTSLIEKEPRASLDYVSVADPDTLEELTEVSRPALVSLAVKIGRTRLIDNITLE